MKQAYVTALIKALQSGQAVEVVLARMKEVLERKGHAKLWPQILRMTNRVLGAKLASHSPQVTVVKTGGVEASVIEKALKSLGVSDTTYTESVDSTLIGGFTVRYEDTVLDLSYKRALIDLYERITKA